MLLFSKALLVEWMLNIVQEELDVADVSSKKIKDMCLILGIETYDTKVDQLRKEVEKTLVALDIDGVNEIADSIMIDGYNIQVQNCGYEDAYDNSTSHLLSKAGLIQRRIRTIG